MRKYHQLLLVLISGISVVVLFTYKMENSRLKDVLTAVNFFSRKDAEELRLVVANNSLAMGMDVRVNFDHPLPVWQQIGTDFHAYTSYWQRNELVASGGEVLTLAVGQSGAVVNFRCAVEYNDGRQVQGRFRFQHFSEQQEPGKGHELNTEPAFTNYIFYCRLKSDLGGPKIVIYDDLNESSMSTGHKLRLRRIKATKHKNEGSQTQLNVCLDLVAVNMSNGFGRNDARLLEFFLHHYTLGIRQFIVYNGDEIGDELLQKLAKHKNLHIHLLPFNFPFTSSLSKESSQLRDLIKADCLLRGMYKTKFTLLLEPNEFFFPNAKLGDDHSVVNSLNSYDPTNTKEFELQTYSVCIDANNKLLTENNFYDPEVPTPHNIYIYKPLVPMSGTSPAANGGSSFNLAPSLAFANRYIECLHIGTDGLHRWDNGLRENFMKNVKDIRLEVKGLMYI